MNSTSERSVVKHRNGFNNSNVSSNCKIGVDTFDIGLHRCYIMKVS